MLVHILRLREGAEMNPFPMQREACRERVSEHLRVGHYTPEIGIDFRGCTGAEALMSAFREIDASTLPDDVRRASTWLRSTTKAGDLVVEEDGMTFVVAPGGFARLSYQFVELVVPVAVPAGDDVAISFSQPPEPFQNLWTVRLFERTFGLSKAAAIAVVRNASEIPFRISRAQLTRLAVGSIRRLAVGSIRETISRGNALDLVCPDLAILQIQPGRPYMSIA